MTKAQLIKALERCEDNVDVLVSLELDSGEILFYDIDFVTPSGDKRFHTLINITHEES